jgi:MoxR-like ATPase
MASAASSVTGLPRFPTSFVGRERAMAEIESAIANGCRVLSLVGIGGVGKTRLAVAVVDKLDTLLRAVTSYLPFAAVRSAS